LKTWNSIYRNHVISTRSPISRAIILKDQYMFLQYLLGRFKSKGGSRETNQWKRKERRINRYGNMAKHTIYILTIRYSSRRDWGSDLFRNILEGFFAFKYSHNLRHWRPERRWLIGALHCQFRTMFVWSRS
jgi:hypothetical protein